MTTSTAASADAGRDANPARLAALKRACYLRFLLELGRMTIAAWRWPNDQAFLRAAYRTYLRREPDEEGFHYYLNALRRKSLRRSELLAALVESNEFKQLHGLSSDHPQWQDALHHARMLLIQQHLPPAGVIVDLGGGSDTAAEGALLQTGYPHQPKEIIIVDLPADARLGGGTGAGSRDVVVTAEGTRIRYLYQSMTRLSSIADSSVDLVWSGESIEHITEEDADIVCREVHRVLKPGGHFCLDTPNAALTRLQSPNELIHPEHKKEYYVLELRNKLERWGFEVVDAKGICPMPQSFQSGSFDVDEILRNDRISESPEDAYLFYLKAIKPA